MNAIFGVFKSGDGDNGASSESEQSPEAPHTVEEVIEQTTALSDSKSGGNGGEKK